MNEKETIIRRTAVILRQMDSGTADIVYRIAAALLYVKKGIYKKSENCIDGFKIKWYNDKNEQVFEIEEHLPK